MRCREDHLQLLPRRLIFGKAHHDELGVADDGREEIVEVVRDAAREHADALELLTLPHRLLGQHAVGHIEDDAARPRLAIGAVNDAEDRSNPENLAARPDHAVLEFMQLACLRHGSVRRHHARAIIRVEAALPKIRLLGPAPRRIAEQLLRVVADEEELHRLRLRLPNDRVEVVDEIDHVILSLLHGAGKLLLLCKRLAQALFPLVKKQVVEQERGCRESSGNQDIVGLARFERCRMLPGTLHAHLPLQVCDSERRRGDGPILIRLDSSMKEASGLVRDRHIPLRRPCPCQHLIEPLFYSEGRRDDARELTPGDFRDENNASRVFRGERRSGLAGLDRFPCRALDVAFKRVLEEIGSLLPGGPGDSQIGVQPARALEARCAADDGRGEFFKLCRSDLH